MELLRKQPDGRWCMFSTNKGEFLIWNATREEIVQQLLDRKEEEIRMRLDEVERHGHEAPETDISKISQDFEKCLKMSQLKLVDGALVNPTED
jgi:hypothetical protein